MPKPQRVTFAYAYTGRDGREYKPGQTAELDFFDARVALGQGRARLADDDTKPKAAPNAPATTTNEGSGTR